MNNLTIFFLVTTTIMILLLFISPVLLIIAIIIFGCFLASDYSDPYLPDPQGHEWRDWILKKLKGD